jgi:hypothetical protein
MPGLLRGIARTAVVAGTASAVSNRVSRRQGQKWAAKEQAPARQNEVPPAASPAPPPAAGAVTTDRLGALKQLGELRSQGVLTEAEFNAEKAKILAS